MKGGFEVLSYEVRRKSDDRSLWAFQIYHQKLLKLESQSKGHFIVRVICDYRASSQKIFEIPFSYLKERILPRAKCTAGRYYFEVDKSSCEFNWHIGIKMNSRQFLK